MKNDFIFLFIIYMGLTFNFEKPTDDDESLLDCLLEVLRKDKDINNPISEEDLVDSAKQRFKVSSKNLSKLQDTVSVLCYFFNKHVSFIDECFQNELLLGNSFNGCNTKKSFYEALCQKIPSDEIPDETLYLYTVKRYCQLESRFYVFNAYNIIKLVLYDKEKSWKYFKNCDENLAKYYLSKTGIYYSYIESNIKADDLPKHDLKTAVRLIRYVKRFAKKYFEPLTLLYRTKLEKKEFADFLSCSDWKQKIISTITDIRKNPDIPCADCEIKSCESIKYHELHEWMTKQGCTDFNLLKNPNILNDEVFIINILGKQRLESFCASRIFNENYDLFMDFIRESLHNFSLIKIYMQCGMIEECDFTSLLDVFANEYKIDGNRIHKLDRIWNYQVIDYFKSTIVTGFNNAKSKKSPTLNKLEHDEAELIAKLKFAEAKLNEAKSIKLESTKSELIAKLESITKSKLIKYRACEVRLIKLSLDYVKSLKVFEEMQKLFKEDEFNPKTQTKRRIRKIIELRPKDIINDDTLLEYALQQAYEKNILCPPIQDHKKLIQEVLASISK